MIDFLRRGLPVLVLTVAMAVGYSRPRPRSGTRATSRTWSL